MDGDGNAWVVAADGQRRWGRYGAAGLLAYVPAEAAAGPRVLVQHRSDRSHYGGRWGLPGGARDSHETPTQAALREAAEEVGADSSAVEPTAQVVDDHGGWSYTTVVAATARPFPVYAANWETADARWLPAAEVADLPLHPVLATRWPVLRHLLRRWTVVVDAANVVGATPNGWWHDRAGAARRLRSGLARLAAVGLPAADLDIAYRVPAGARLTVTVRPRFVLVVEGAAAGVAGEPAPPGVRVLHRPGSGDDTVAAIARELRDAGPAGDPAAGPGGGIVVVTADRGLRARVEPVGATCHGARWLLGRIPPAAPDPPGASGHPALPAG